MDTGRRGLGNIDIKRTNGRSYDYRMNIAGKQSARFDLFFSFLMGFALRRGQHVEGVQRVDEIVDRCICLHTYRL